MRIGFVAFLALLGSAGAVSAQDDPKKAAQEEAKQLDEEAKSKVAAFKKELKTCRTDADRATLIGSLGGPGSLQHPRVLDELKGWLKYPAADVAISAAEQIGKYEKNKDAAEALLSTAGARRDKEAIVKCLRYAGDVGHRPSTAKLLPFFKNKDVDIAKEAIDSCAKLKSTLAIDPLLGLWKDLDAIRDEKEAGGLGDLGGGLTGANPLVEEQKRRKIELTRATEDALGKITGAEFKTQREASDWWRKSRGTFKEPD